MKRHALFVGVGLYVDGETAVDKNGKVYKREFDMKPSTEVKTARNTE